MNQILLWSSSYARVVVRGAYCDTKARLREHPVRAAIGQHPVCRRRLQLGGVQQALCCLQQSLAAARLCSVHSCGLAVRPHVAAAPAGTEAGGSTERWHAGALASPMPGENGNSPH